MKAKLTRTLIEKINTPGFTWDVVIPGFGLRVSPGGRKAYVLFYRDKYRRQHVYTIANYPETTPERARQEAARLKTMIRLEGYDPLKAKEPGVKFDTLVKYYLEERASQKRSGKWDSCVLDKYVKPYFIGKPVLGITRDDIINWHRRTGAEYGEVAANRALRLLAMVLNYGIKRGALPVDFTPPTRGVTLFKEMSRSRVLTRDEIKAIWSGLEQFETDFRCFVRLALLTGMRPGEILNLQRGDIKEMIKDGKKEWSIVIPPERSKNKKPMLYTVSEVAIAVLREAMENTDRNEIFGGKRRMSYYRSRWAELLERVGIQDAHFHDLRRTFATLAGAQGVPFHVVSRLLNHTKLDITAIYARATDEAVRSAAEKVGQLFTAKGEAVEFKICQEQG